MELLAGLDLFCPKDVGFVLFLLSPPTRELVGQSVIISYHIGSYQHCGKRPF